MSFLELGIQLQSDRFLRGYLLFSGDFGGQQTSDNSWTNAFDPKEKYWICVHPKMHPSKIFIENYMKMKNFEIEIMIFLSPKFSKFSLKMYENENF